jgi:hypothetical protein
VTVPRDHEVASGSAPNEPAAQRPEMQPMETNDVMIVGVGTALFAIAFVVMLPLHASLVRDGHGRWLWIALSGALLGLLGVVYCRRRAQRMSKTLPKGDTR